MIYVGIDIANDSNVCSIINEKEVLLKNFTFTNNVIGFNKLNLILNKYRSKKSIRIGYESTSGISEGLKQYLEKHQYIYCSNTMWNVLNKELYLNEQLKLNMRPHLHPIKCNIKEPSPT